MHVSPYLIPTLYNLFYKPWYEDWGFWLSVLNLILIIWTIAETNRLRNETQRQTILEHQPHLSFAQAVDRRNYAIVNPSKNSAFNVYIFAKLGKRFRILDRGLLIGVLPSGDKYEFNNKSDLVEKNEEELVAINPKIAALLSLFRQKYGDEDYQAIVYRDLFGNQMYSIFFVSSESLPYDNFSEVGTWSA